MITNGKRDCRSFPVLVASDILRTFVSERLQMTNVSGVAEATDLPENSRGAGRLK